MFGVFLSTWAHPSIRQHWIILVGRLIGRWFMATTGIDIFNSVQAMERGKCVNIVPTSQRAGLQMYRQIIGIIGILT